MASKLFHKNPIFILDAIKIKKKTGEKNIENWIERGG